MRQISQDKNIPTYNFWLELESKARYAGQIPDTARAATTGQGCFACQQKEIIFMKFLGLLQGVSEQTRPKQSVPNSWS